MARLIYSALASLDGYTQDKQGEFGWAAPDAEVHAFVNDLERQAGTYLYGRRMYETMAGWQTMGTGDDDPPVSRDYGGIWRGADKIVYSRTLTSPATPQTIIEPDFDPAEVRKLKADSYRDLTVGGADLAGQALAAGLVDECRLFLFPVIVGGGQRALPDDVHLQLELVSEHRFTSGVVYLEYRVRS